MKLADDVYNYYITHQNLLADDKLFHFATRTAAWFGREESFDILKRSRYQVVEPQLPLNEVIANIYNAPIKNPVNAYHLRQPFFEKYPQLYGAHLALFRVRHLEAVYGIDARDALFATISKEELIDLRDKLLADDDGLRVLSTFAINFCYLLETVILKQDHSLPLDRFLEIGASYDTSKATDIQLLIYFYTHCIIGETNFYVRTIPNELLSIYREMLRRIELLIRTHFDSINLDNKLEFLVCSRICDYKTDLYEQIYRECEQSISEEGTFIVDRHNSNAQEDRRSFSSSEHRNVLFIMSTAPYAPHSTLVN